jgi:hypothetical protein
MPPGLPAMVLGPAAAGRGAVGPKVIPGASPDNNLMLLPLLLRPAPAGSAPFCVV